jgi:NAD(P)-dependent dehydrogenase (short-subunit alcohol dehydrogenase family)
VSGVFRAELLDGMTVATAGPVRSAVREKLLELGGTVVELAGDLNRLAPVAVVYDAAPAFAGGGSEALREAVDRGWDAIGEAARELFIPADNGGRFVLLAPRPGDGPFAEPVRAALENLARTLSIEWARYAITTTAITPGDSTGDADVATLVAFLVSSAGAYYSGCRFSLGAL